MHRTRSGIRMDELDYYEPLKLKASAFEGLLVRSTLHKEGKLRLCFTVEHHETRSLGGYEILVNDERESVFFTVKEAVEHFNELREGAPSNQKDTHQQGRSALTTKRRRLRPSTV